MIWFLENPVRSKQERHELEQLVGSVGWLVAIGWRMSSSRLSWDADIVIGERVYPITLRYPNHFPFSPVLVLPRGDESRWSSHQYGPGGELCLEYGPDNWHQDVTGAMMVRSAHRLLQAEAQASSGGPEVPSRHRSNLGEQLSGKHMRYVFAWEARSVLATLRDDELIQATSNMDYYEHGSVRFLATAETKEGQWKATLPEPFLYESISKATALIRWPDGVDLPPTNSAKLMRSAIAARSMDSSFAETIVLVRGTIVSAYQLNDEKDSVYKLSLILQDQRKNRLDPSHEVLKERKVALIGCGSMGSKIATTLARSGVSQFVLVDADIFLPENLVRNDFDWREIGLHKVDAAASKIQLVNPAAKCEQFRRALGEQASSGAIEGLIEILEGCDLLIDAAAESSAFEVLSAVTSFAKRPFVWGEVFSGGIGGMIARSRPGLEPNSSVMRRTIEDWCADQGRTISRSAAPYESNDEAPAIASDADVSIIAGHLAAFAIDTLLSRSPSAYPHAVYLIGLQAEWIFDQALEVRPIDVGQPDDSATPPVEECRTEIMEILKQLAEHPDANTD
jgi:molybdopterin/thiamine biosynthesis adenylyltransferase